jgi:H+/Cl- antiporter ClcA
MSIVEKEKAGRFLATHPLLRVVLILLLAALMCGIAWWHFSRGYHLVAILADFPFILLALLAAAGSYLEWKSPQKR